MIAAAIFDLNGTLIDDMPAHGRAWAAVFRELGVDVPPERFERELAGMKHGETFEAVLGRKLPDAEARRLGDRKDALYREIYKKDLRLLAGARELLQRMRAARNEMGDARDGVPVANEMADTKDGVPVANEMGDTKDGVPVAIKTAIATAAPKANRDFAVDGLGIRALFDAIVGEEVAARGKPAPDLYLAAARALSVDPERCLVFEDAVNGIRAARAAKMQAAAVTTTTPAEALREAGAAFLLEDFAHLPPALEALIFS